MEVIRPAMKLSSLANPYSKLNDNLPNFAWGPIHKGQGRIPIPQLWNRSPLPKNTFPVTRVGNARPACHSTT